MRKLLNLMMLSVFAVSLSWTGSALAESEKGFGMKHKKSFNVERKIHKLKKKLNLSDTQVASIKPILTQAKETRKANHGKIKALRDQGMSREEIRAKFKAEHQQVRQATHDKILSVLNAEQAAQMKTIWEKRKSKREERREKRKEKRNQ